MIQWVFVHFLNQAQSDHYRPKPGPKLKKQQWPSENYWYSWQHATTTNDRVAIFPLVSECFLSTLGRTKRSVAATSNLFHNTKGAHTCEPFPRQADVLVAFALLNCVFSDSYNSWLINLFQLDFVRSISVFFLTGLHYATPMFFCHTQMQYESILFFTNLFYDFFSCFM